MNEDVLNTSIRRFLKTVGGINLTHTIEDKIELE